MSINIRFRQSFTTHYLLFLPFLISQYVRLLLQYFSLRHPTDACVIHQIPHPIFLHSVCDIVPRPKLTQVHSHTHQVINGVTLLRVLWDIEHLRECKVSAQLSHSRGEAGQVDDKVARGVQERTREAAVGQEVARIAWIVLEGLCTSEGWKGIDKGRVWAGKWEGQSQVVLEGADLCTTGSACY
jgi:hypothetical protein